MPVTRQHPSDDLSDADVPATVVCARCGDPACGGCTDDDDGRSGVIAVVPWERPRSAVRGRSGPFGSVLGGTLTRLWATARATTFDAERFFESLPDGPIGPALGFAVAGELIASTAMALVVGGAVALIAPGWTRYVLLADAHLPLRLAAVAVPSVASLLVVAHAAHGWALDWGARRVGAPPALTRALRFGLYAAGWDVVLGPIGLVVVGLRSGLRAALSVASVSVGLPARSTRAFLRGCYRLQGDAARVPLRASYAIAGFATLAGSIAVLAALACAWLA